jgi:hypothetical protein
MSCSIAFNSKITNVFYEPSQNLLDPFLKMLGHFPFMILFNSTHPQSINLSFTQYQTLLPNPISPQSIKIFSFISCSNADPSSPPQPRPPGPACLVANLILTRGNPRVLLHVARTATSVI